jgi:hypothetical protein
VAANKNRLEITGELSENAGSFLATAYLLLLASVARTDPYSLAGLEAHSENQNRNNILKLPKKKNAPINPWP